MTPLYISVHTTDPELRKELLLYKKTDNFLDKINPDYIINCIRCLIEDSELNPLKAINYNSYFP